LQKRALFPWKRRAGDCKLNVVSVLRLLIRVYDGESIQLSVHQTLKRPEGKGDRLNRRRAAEDVRPVIREKQ
jgi:hypothetical protein